MPTIHVNGVDLHYETAGDGPPLVLVHGSLGDHSNWLATAALLADFFRVITYDRRSHSRSERPAGPRSRRQDEDDLAALIEALDCAPAHVAATSFGGLVALGLAARRPELMRSVTVHEPPALSVAAGGELARLGDQVAATVTVVLSELQAGNVERGTRRFVEDVALGPGAWALLPEPVRATCLGNAPAFVAEQRDPDCFALDTDALEPLADRILLTKGDASLPWFAPLVDRIAELLPAARTATIAGAGHTPHVTHPDAYSELVAAWASELLESLTSLS